MDKKDLQKYFIFIVVSSILLSSFFGFSFAYFANIYFAKQNVAKENSENKNVEIEQKEKTVVRVNEESSVIDVADKVSPAVVSIIISKNLPVWERYYEQNQGDVFDQLFGLNTITPQYRQNGTVEKEIGGGSGFIVSADGYIVTNKHVVEDESANYTVLMSDERKYEARVLARDTVTDLAVLKIEPKVQDNNQEKFSYVEFGDSADLKVGQSVVAIGNALAEFRNTVSTGVISGLSRSITAGGGVMNEQLSGLIQTDASINPGNSGGPLLNLAGQVIGVNTAMAQAENIGFAIPVNEIKKKVKSVQEKGKIVRPWIGVRYVLVDKKIAKENNFNFDYGALLIKGNNKNDLAVTLNSPAEKAGLLEGDFILEINEEKINTENTLTDVINKLDVGDEIKLKISRKREEKELKLTIGEL